MSDTSNYYMSVTGKSRFIDINDVITAKTLISTQKVEYKVYSKSISHFFLQDNIMIALHPSDIVKKKPTCWLVYIYMYICTFSSFDLIKCKQYLYTLFIFFLINAVMHSWGLCILNECLIKI